MCHLHKTTARVKIILKFIPSLLAIALLLTVDRVAAQDGSSNSSSSGVTATGSNFLRVGDGFTQNGSDPIVKRYLEEIANARIAFSNFSLGLRYEMDDPSEVGRSFQGLRRRWIQYRKDGIDLQAGDVSTLYGRGLSLNLFESRPLNFDCWLDGASAGYEHTWKQSDIDFRPSVKIRGIAGNLDFYNVVDTAQPVMHVSARSANAEFGLFGKKLLVGGTFVQAFTNTNRVFGIQNLATVRQVNQPGMYLNFLTGPVEGFFEWTQDRTNASRLLNAKFDTVHIGNAWYGSLSYATSILGLTVEYKNYRYYLHEPGAKFSDVFTKLPITNPPEVYKDFTFTEITRTTHAVNFDDEVGYQAEANITAIPNWTFTLNGAASSRHTKYVADSNSNPVAVGSTDFLPTLSDRGYYPFWEYYVDAEYEWAELNYVRFGFHHRSDVIVYSLTNDANSDFRWTTTVAMKAQIETRPNESFLGIFEHQWEYDAARITEDKRILNELLTLQYSFNPIITFGGIMDLAVQYDGVPYHIEDSWFQAFASVRIGQSNTVLVSYGAERGGLNCTGGICRVVPAFKGLRVSMTTQM